MSGIGIGMSPQWARASTKIGAVAPTITPTLGSELITNGDMETGDPPTGWVAEGGCTISASPTAHGGSQGLSVVAVTAFLEFCGNLVNVDQWGWYALTGWGRTGVQGNAAGLALTNTHASAHWNSPFLSATYTQRFFRGFVTQATVKAIIQPYNLFGGSAGDEAIGDDVSLKKIDHDSMFSYIGDVGRQDGTFVCHAYLPFQPNNPLSQMQCGIAFNYRDADNYMLLMADGTEANTTVWKKINGAYTQVLGGPTSRGAEIKVVVTGTTYKLYYQGSQYGGDQIVDEPTLGTEIHAFTSDAAATAGLIEAYP